MGHVSVENLVNYLDGSASESETAALDNHLSTCAECGVLKREFQALMLQLREDATFEPPADLLQWGVDLFQPIVQPQSGGLRRIIASLIFDTFDQPMLAGVRR